MVTVQVEVADMAFRLKPIAAHFVEGCWSLTLPMMRVAGCRQILWRHSSGRQCATFRRQLSEAIAPSFYIEFSSLKIDVADKRKTGRCSRDVIDPLETVSRRLGRRARRSRRRWGPGKTTDASPEVHNGRLGASSRHPAAALHFPLKPRPVSGRRVLYRVCLLFKNT